MHFVCVCETKKFLFKISFFFSKDIENKFRSCLGMCSIKILNHGGKIVPEEGSLRPSESPVLGYSRDAL